MKNTFCEVTRPTTAGDDWVPSAFLTAVKQYTTTHLQITRNTNSRVSWSQSILLTIRQSHISKISPVSYDELPYLCSSKHYSSCLILISYKWFTVIRAAGQILQAKVCHLVWHHNRIYDISLVSCFVWKTYSLVLRDSNASNGNRWKKSYIEYYLQKIKLSITKWCFDKTTYRKRHNTDADYSHPAWQQRWTWGARWPHWAMRLTHWTDDLILIFTILIGESLKICAW